MGQLGSRELERRVRDTRAWIDANHDHLSSISVAELNEFMEGSSRRIFKVVGIPLGTLGRCRGAVGVLRLVDGDRSGWDEVAVATDVLAWEVRVRVELVDAGLVRAAPALTLRLSDAASVACVSPVWEAEMAAVVRRVVDDPSLVDSSFWASRRFEPFVVRVLEVGAGAPASGVGLAEPYRSVMERWDDTEALGEALVEVCQFHVENMEDDGVDWPPPFRDTPFDLLPVEVMLVERVRGRLGLEMPVVEHPLVSACGLGPLPVVEVDPLLARVSVEFDRWFGDGVDSQGAVQD